MKTATITITEDENDMVDCHVKFGPDGLDEDSAAHHLAAAAMQFLASQHQGDDEPEFSLNER